MLSKNLIKTIRSLNQKKYRLQEGLFVAEGPKVVGDLMQRYVPQVLIATEEWWTANVPPLSRATECISVSNDDLRKASFLQHPQQVMALFPLPATIAGDTPLLPDDKELLIALDGVQDPGNLGTIIRIADWFGIRRIIGSLSTADAFNPKVVQATMGSISRVDISYTDLDRWMSLLPSSLPIYGTLLDGRDIYHESLTPHGIIVMGNEGNGISPVIRKRVTHALRIPMFQSLPGAESLNVAVATAITCSEFRRRSEKPMDEVSAG